jgi:DNA-binding CsgD family transcriptional regulator
LTAVIGPLAVDGLMVMATGALIATSTRRSVTEAATTATRAETSPPPVGHAAPPTDAPLRPVLVVEDEMAALLNSAASAPKRPARRTAKTDTGAAVARLRTRHPDMPTVEIAKRLKVSDRTVRRHLSRTETTESTRPDLIAA